MLEVYEGTLGGGKSYHAVERALRYLAGGGRVFSNIELVPGECAAYVRDNWGLELQWDEQYHFLSAHDIARLHEVVKGGTKDAPVLCILDEIHLYHNARDWASASKGLLQWLTQSRKLFVDVICITQHRNNLDKQWVRLVAKYWRFRDLRKYRLPGLGLKIPFVECLASEFDQDGRTLIRREWERFEKRVFRCYCSEQLFDGCVAGFAGAGLERVKLQKVKRKGKFMKVLLWFVLLLVAVGLVVFFRIKNKDSELEKALTGRRPAKVEQAEDRPLRSPSPPVRMVPDWVCCDGWCGRDGKIVSAYSSEWRLVFRGPPDRLEDGLPVYAYRRGQPAF